MVKNILFYCLNLLYCLLQIVIYKDEDEDGNKNKDEDEDKKVVSYNLVSSNNKEIIHDRHCERTISPDYFYEQ